MNDKIRRIMLEANMRFHAERIADLEREAKFHRDMVRACENDLIELTLDIEQRGCYTDRVRAKQGER